MTLTADQCLAVEAMMISREGAMIAGGIEPVQVFVSPAMRGLWDWHGCADGLEVCGMIVSVDFRLGGMACYCVR